MAGAPKAAKPAAKVATTSTAKAADKPAGAPAGKAAAAPGKPGKPGPEKSASGKAPAPDKKDAKGGKGAPPSDDNLPDAALLDENGEPIPAPAAGWRAWLEPGRKRWIALGTAATCVVLIVTASVVTASYLKSPPPPAPETDTIAGAALALDGGTLIVSGQTLRLEDIDAPPASLVCRDGAWKYRCGDEAKFALATAVGSGPVECVHPHSVAGGQLAALCRNEAGLDIAAIQVENGWAVNDIRRSSRYIAEEMRARASSSGLWGNDFAQHELGRQAGSESAAEPKAPDSGAHRR